MSGAIQNPKSSWFDDDDDVDDEMFLKNSRKPPASQSSQSNSIAQLQATRNAVESRTLESTERSLQMLRESEQVGMATAQELAEQREKLERTSKNLDTINATLRTTQRNIDGMKSIFTTFKNYLTRPKETNIKPGSRDLAPEPSPSASSYQEPESQPTTTTAVRHRMEFEKKPANAQEAIDRNLDYMSSNITNLKGLALNLGDEILDQNELLDNMYYKSDKAGANITKQNAEINRLLGKK